jgi:hypothetical protein
MAAAAAESLLTPTMVEATVTLAGVAPGAPASPVPGDLEVGIIDVEDLEQNEPEVEDDLQDTVPGSPVVPDDRLSCPASAATSLRPPVAPAVAQGEDSLERRVERLEARFLVLKRKAAVHFEQLEKQIDAVYDVASAVNRQVTQVADHAQETRRVVKRLAIAAARSPAPQLPSI